MLQAPVLLLAAIKEAVPVTKSSQASPAASKLVTDVGQRDPVDFPRPPGLVRTSFSEAKGKHNDEEIANYHSNAGFDETVALYLEGVPAAGWKKLSDSVSGSGSNRLRMIEWEKPAKAVEVRFYTNKNGGSDLRVRIFTYKTNQATPPAKSSAAARAADTTALKAAPGAKVDPTKTAELSKKFGTAPVGPPPTNFQIISTSAYLHNLSWSHAGAATCDVYRVDSSGRTQVADHITEKKFTDRAFLEPNTIYRLVVHYADGSEGNLEYTYVNPRQPLVVTDLKAVLSGPGKHKLTWQQTSHYEVYWQPKTNPPNIYQVFGPTLPAEGMGVKTNSAELTDVPVGNHSVRVALLYGDGDPPQLVPAPKVATVNFDVLPDRARYRIVFLGLHCEHETKDDPFQLDGKRDEVYAGAFSVMVPLLSYIVPPAPVSFVRTKVMGDTNGYPSRLPAGTASPAGGIQSGDYVPSSAASAPQPGVATTSDRFPLQVWEGELRDGGDLLVISPVLFSWNKADEVPWNSWTGWWSVTNNAAQVRDMARQGVRPDKLAAVLSWEWQANKWAGGYLDPIGSAFDFSDPNRKRRIGPGYDLKADRPIGLRDQHSGGAFNVPNLVWEPAGLVLTHANLEAKLGSNNAVVYSWACIDDNYSNAALGGEYYLYIQIERLAPPP